MASITNNILAHTLEPALVLRIAESVHAAGNGRGLELCKKLSMESDQHVFERYQNPTMALLARWAQIPNTTVGQLADALLSCSPVAYEMLYTTFGPSARAYHEECMNRAKKMRARCADTRKVIDVILNHDVRRTLLDSALDQDGTFNWVQMAIQLGYAKESLEIMSATDLLNHMKNGKPLLCMQDLAMAMVGRCKTALNVLCRYAVSEAVARCWQDDHFYADRDLKATMKSLSNSPWAAHLKPIEGPAAAAVAAASAAAAEASPAAASSSSAVVAKRPKNSDDDNGLCVVCLVEPYTVMCIPCNHLCTCKACTPTSNRCPLCGQAITRTERVYPA
jgi:hypothetical protein